MHVPGHIIEMLISRGLVVGEPFPSGHVEWPDGRAIGKPKSMGGNGLPDYECYWGDLGETAVILDAPVAHLHYADESWFVTVHEYLPGPGPGDFVNQHATPELAANDILDYFFGGFDRMKLKLDDRISGNG